MLFFYVLILIYRDVSFMLRFSFSFFVYFDFVRSSFILFSIDLIVEFKKVVVVLILKKIKKSSEEGKMNFIYFFGGLVKIGVVSNGVINYNSNGIVDKVRI